ncbi:MAG: class I SAM-dependent methyltransferase, partial [Bacteroidetes bacterium]|nr:class I SAM-dependent methyltransferase [Bacteroidota bacterium]
LIQNRKTIAVDCNICGETPQKLLWVKNYFRYVKCRVCGLVFVNPQLTQPEVEKIYSIGYDSKSSAKPPPSDFFKFETVLKKINKYKSNNRFLDIGCFKGHFMKAVQQKGWDVFGTELSEKAVEYAREYTRGTVKLGSVVDADFSAEYFDVASMVDVIEHLDDPGKYLAETHRILRKGGLIYIETPNFNSIPRIFLGINWSIFFPWHAYYFTPKTLKIILKKAGFTNIKVKSIGLGSFSKYNPLDDLEKSGNIARQSRANFKKELRKFRLLKRSFYFIKSLTDYLYGILSFFGLNIGVKIVATAEK